MKANNVIRGKCHRGVSLVTELAWCHSDVNWPSSVWSFNGRLPWEGWK